MIFFVDHILINLVMIIIIIKLFTLSFLGESENYKKKLNYELQEKVSAWAKNKCKELKINIADRWDL